MDLSHVELLQPGGRELEPAERRDRADVGACRQDPNHPARSTSMLEVPEARQPYADRLRGAVPGAGHLVHMPSHIYYRVGRYLDALVDNSTAAAVDEKYLAASDAPMGVYRLGYYPHNVHFVMASALMAGDGANSISAAEKLHGLLPDAAALAIPGAHPVKAAPYYAHTLFSSPDAILALPDPGNPIPYVKAMWHSRPRRRLRGAPRFRCSPGRGERHRCARAHGRFRAAQARPAFRRWRCCSLRGR